MTLTLREFYATLPRAIAPGMRTGIEVEADIESLRKFEVICQTWEPAIKGNIDSTLYILAARGRDLALPDHLVFQNIRDYYVPRLANRVEDKGIWKCVNNAEKYAKHESGNELPAAKFQEMAPTVTFAPPPSLLPGSPLPENEAAPDTVSKSQLRLQMMIQSEMIASEWIWRDKAKGLKENCLANMVFALRTEAGEKFRLNDFSGEIEFEDKPFWRDDVLVKGYSLQDEDEKAFQNWFSNKYTWEVSKERVWTAIYTVAQIKRYHPLAEYLNSLVWDGQPRLDRMLIDTLGCVDTRLNREISRCTAMSACQRIVEPGCKQDHVLMLESGQGFEKSKWVEALGGRFASTGALEQGNKDTYICLKGNWIIELAEFDGMSTKAHFAWMKSIISNRIDNFRAVYASSAQKVPRESIFIATINPNSTGEYLKDSENRRFWPVKVRKADITFLKTWRDQYFAEAMRRLRQGEPWWITDPEILADARLEQDKRRERDPWSDLLEGWVSNRSSFSSLDVYSALGFSGAQIKSQERNRIYAVLRSFGFDYVQGFKGAGRWEKEMDWESLK